MKELEVIKTERLILRQWRKEDFIPFAKLNADPLVRRYFSSVLTREKSDESAIFILNEIEKKGYGFWAVSVPGVSDFIGFIGIREVDFESHFTPAVEIGWRLSHEFWGKGYATEGALAALKYGFKHLNLEEIVAFAVANNVPSRRVMERIGMSYNERDDFDHPDYHEKDPLKRHVLYRIKTGYFTEIFKTPPKNFKPSVEVAACYVEINGKILLMERALGALEGGTWGVPAGKIERGESPEEAAVRELFEETGIEVSKSQLKEIGRLFVQKPRGDFIYHAFQVHLKEVPKVLLSQEHVKYLWAGDQEIDTLPLIGGGREALNFFKEFKDR